MAKTTRLVKKWTDTAKKCLGGIPPRYSRVIVSQIGKLDDDPRERHKPLQGPLLGLYSMKISKYRLIYKAEEEHISSGDVLLHLTFCFLANGKKTQFDKRDAFDLAQRLIHFGVIGHGV